MDDIYLLDITISVALYNMENFVSKENYSEIQSSTALYSNMLNLANINKKDFSILNKADILHDLFKKISVNTINVDAEIVELVNDNFWDLL